MVCPTAKFGFNVLSIDLREKNRRACETVETTAQSVVHLQLSATSHNVTCILLADFEERDLSQAGSQHRQS